jgi:MFS family permease
VSGARQQLREALAAVGQVFANPDLRRIQLAFAGSVIGRYSGIIVITIYCYHAGGVTAVAVVSLVRQVAATIITPFAASLADRFPRPRVMLVSDVGRAACSAGMAAVAAAHGPHLAVYAIAVCSTILSTPFRPAEAALTTDVARSPQELAAANVATSTFDSIGIFAGPAIGATLVAVSGYAAGFLFTAVAFVWSAFNVVRISVPERSAESPTVEEEQDDSGGVLAGFLTVAQDERLRLVVVLYGAQCLVAGALSVAEVAMALSLLQTGNAGVGVLETVCGVGAIVGAGASLGMVGGSRLGASLGAGLVLWGAPLLLVAAFPRYWVAGLAMAALGFGNSVVDVAATTLLQRSTPTELMARVFGVFETVTLITYALGTLAVPPLVHLFGIRTTLLIMGAILPALALLGAQGLRKIDLGGRIPTEQIDAVRTVPFLAVLPTQTIEYLAEHATKVELAAQERLFSQGDDGDAFYVLEAGSLTVDLPEGTKLVEAPGYVGEIALLRDVPRTATVRAASDVTLWALDRSDFLDAVAGHRRANARAESVVASRVGPVPAV